MELEPLKDCDSAYRVIFDTVDEMRTLRGAWEEQNADQVASGLESVESNADLIRYFNEKKLKHFKGCTVLPSFCIAKTNVLIDMIQPLQTYANTTDHRIVEMAISAPKGAKQAISERNRLRHVADTMVFNLEGLLEIEEIVEAANGRIFR